MRKPIWDDAAFVRWVQDGAKRQGLTLREVLVAAGVSRFYLKEPRENRGTNIVLNLSEILHTSPAALFGLPDMPETDEAFRAWRRLVHQLPGLEAARTERLKLTARVIATGLATWVQIASDRSDSDPVALFELVLRELNGSRPTDEPTDDNPEQPVS